MASVAKPLRAKTIQSNNDLKISFITDDLGMLVSYDGRVIGQHSSDSIEGHIHELGINDWRICRSIEASPGAHDKKERGIINKEGVLVEIPGQRIHECDLHLRCDDSRPKQACIRHPM